MTTTARPRSAKQDVPPSTIPAAPTVERAFARGASFAREERTITLLVAYLGPLLDEIDDPVSRAGGARRRGRGRGRRAGRVVARAARPQRPSRAAIEWEGAGGVTERLIDAKAAGELLGVPATGCCGRRGPTRSRICGSGTTFGSTPTRCSRGLGTARRGPAEPATDRKRRPRRTHQPRGPTPTRRRADATRIIPPPGLWDRLAHDQGGCPAAGAGSPSGGHSGQTQGQAPVAAPSAGRPRGADPHAGRSPDARR